MPMKDEWQTDSTQTAMSAKHITYVIPLKARCDETGPGSPGPIRAVAADCCRGGEPSLFQAGGADFLSMSEDQRAIGTPFVG